MSTFIQIHDDSCWVCGDAFGPNKGVGIQRTLHHVLPKHLKPKKNVLLPICEKCHEAVNTQDIRGIIKFAYKIEQMTKELGQAFGALKGNIVGFIKRQDEQNKKLNKEAEDKLNPPADMDMVVK